MQSPNTSPELIFVCALLVNVLVLLAVVFWMEMQMHKHSRRISDSAFNQGYVEGQKAVRQRTQWNREWVRTPKGDRSRFDPLEWDGEIKMKTAWNGRGE